MGLSEVRTEEQLLDELEHWLGELVALRDQLRAIEGVLGVNRVRAVLEERRQSAEEALQRLELAKTRAVRDALRAALDQSFA